jgi:hypothetical protein
MVALIEPGEPNVVHPYWAPFVVVGEGVAGIGTLPSRAPLATSVPTGSVDPAPAPIHMPTQPAILEPPTPTRDRASSSGGSQIRSQGTYGGVGGDGSSTNAPLGRNSHHHPKLLDEVLNGPGVALLKTYDR